MIGEFDVNKELDTILKRNGLSITADEYTSITEAYEEVMREEARQYSNYTSKYQLLQGITQQTKQGASQVDVIQTFSDVRHFEFYETFMGTDERRRLVNTLRENGIPLDILKGVRVKVDGDNLKPIKGISIDYDFQENEHGSLVLTYFEVTKDGEKVFVFNNPTSKGRKRKDTWREVSGAKSLYGGTITNTPVGKVKIWKSAKTGKIYYTDSYGHRVKVKDGVVQERVIWGEEL